MASSRRSSRLQLKQVTPPAASIISRSSSISSSVSRNKSPAGGTTQKQAKSILLKRSLTTPSPALETRRIGTRRSARGKPPIDPTELEKKDLMEREAKENTVRYNRIKGKKRRVEYYSSDDSVSDSVSEDDVNQDDNFEPSRCCDSPVNFDDDLNNVGEFLAYSKLDDQNIHYMIGFERYKFEFLYTCIMNTKLKFPFGAVPILDQLFITLFKFRHNSDCKVIALMFGLPNEMSVSDICSKWTVLLTAFLNMVGFRCVDIGGTDLHAVIRDTCDILLKKSQNFSNTPRMTI